MTVPPLLTWLGGWGGPIIGRNISSILRPASLTPQPNHANSGPASHRISPCVHDRSACNLVGSKPLKKVLPLWLLSAGLVYNVSRSVIRFRVARRPSYERKAMKELMDRITINPKQCGGRPCIRGMRIRVVDVLELLSTRLNAEEILDEMPDLEREDLQAALRYAARTLDHPVLAA